MNKNEKSLKPRYNVSLVLAFITFILLVLSISLNSNIYAKYKSGDDSSDEARVAKFSIDSNLDTSALNSSFMIKPTDGAKNYTITIDNDSEVAVRYTLSIISTANYPLKYDLKVNGVSIENNDMNYYGTTGVHTIGVDSSEEVTLTITWDTDKNDYHYSTEVELIEIDLIVDQAD